MKETTKTKQTKPTKISDEPTKTCGKCHRTLTTKDFWKSRAAKDGLQSWCKDCNWPAPIGTHTTDLTKVITVEQKTAKKKPAYEKEERQPGCVGRKKKPASSKKRPKKQ